MRWENACARVEREVNAKLHALDRQVAESVLAGSFDALFKQYEADGEVLPFLHHLREFALENVELLREREQPNPEQQPMLPAGAGQPDPFVAFRCNVFIDNATSERPPIIVEPNPSWTNLFGRIDRKAFWAPTSATTRCSSRAPCTRPTAAT